MVDILVPTHRALIVNGRLIPVALRHTVGAAVRDESDIADLPHALGGRAETPQKAVRIVADDGTQIMITGMGQASAAEIQDLAYAALDKAREQAKKNGGRVFNFRAQREIEGHPPIEKVPDMIREALRERVKRHLANPVTDPPRQMRYMTPEEERKLDDELARLTDD